MDLELARKLIDLGFDPETDFVCQDDSDGHGPYIRHWLSAQPCPFPDMVREPIPVEPPPEEPQE